MEILYLLVPISVILVFLIAVTFWWSLRSGQYDDMEGPGYRMLMDDDKKRAADVGAEGEGESSAAAGVPPGKKQP